MLAHIDEVGSLGLLHKSRSNGRIITDVAGAGFLWGKISFHPPRAKVEVAGEPWSISPGGYIVACMIPVFCSSFEANHDNLRVRAYAHGRTPCSRSAGGVNQQIPQALQSVDKRTVST
jgi:hypothetical protein